jgi:TRAP-type C4-dicarboxylate transport system permease large subunit
MLLTLPILLPILTEAKINLLWFGIILAKLLEIGMITPPIGLNVFVIKSVVGDSVSTSRIFHGIMWFLVADLFIVATLIAFPQTVLYLPSIMAR